MSFREQLIRGEEASDRNEARLIVGGGGGGGNESKRSPVCLEPPPPFDWADTLRVFNCDELIFQSCPPVTELLFEEMTAVLKPRVDDGMFAHRLSTDDSLASGDNDWYFGAFGEDNRYSG